ncbi:unnamed protein product [Eretmochelys imbricata]
MCHANRDPHQRAALLERSTLKDTEAKSLGEIHTPLKQLLANNSQASHPISRKPAARVLATDSPGDQGSSCSQQLPIHGEWRALGHCLQTLRNLATVEEVSKSRSGKR